MSLCDQTSLPPARLVVDNSSLSDSECPRDLASTNSGSCHRPGTALRRVHSSTALGDSPNQAATSCFPPSRSTSVLTLIGTASTGLGGVGQGQFVPSNGNRQYHRLVGFTYPRNGRCMTQRTDDELIIERLERVLADMGWDERELARGLYRRMGYSSAKSVTHWFNRSRALPSMAALREVCAYLGIDPAYVIGMHDDLYETADPHGRFALAVKRPTA